MPVYGGVEAGGTKFVCMTAKGPDEILSREQFPTTSPEETLPRMVAFFKDQKEAIASVGVGSFGPLDPDPKSEKFGYITTTPKPGWGDTDVISPLRQTLKVPVGFDTDVNAAALGERRWGAAQGLDVFVYLTVGTGIGGGAYLHGNLLHGLMHPEMGHVLIRHDWEQDPFPGTCPYHRDCLEGLAAGPALELRWQQRGETLPENHPAWDLEAHYLALGLVEIFTILSPQRVILGGGVMKQKQLFPLIRRKVQEYLNGYLQVPEILNKIDQTIVPPGLGDNAGVLGAIALAERALEQA